MAAATHAPEPKIFGLQRQEQPMRISSQIDQWHYTVVEGLKHHSEDFKEIFWNDESPSEGDQADSTSPDSVELLWNDEPCSEGESADSVSPAYSRRSSQYGTTFAFLDSLLWWWWVALFVALALIASAVTGDTFFGLITGGVVQSLHLKTRLEMTWHMIFGSLMWALAFVQIFCRRLRSGHLAWIHRLSGRLLLLTWFLVVGPTAAYLSLFVGVGKARAQLIMMGFALTGMDTTVWASYYMWRALLVARRQRRGKASMALHGRAMRLGMLFTMLILMQRPAQFFFIAGRKVVLLLLAATTGDQSLPPALAWLSGCMDLAFDHNVILSLTTLFPAGLMLLVVDGPRSNVGRVLVALEAGEEEELFGSRAPSKWELLFWRVRVPVYILLRMAVTNAWTTDPAG